MIEGRALPWHYNWSWTPNFRSQFHAWLLLLSPPGECWVWGSGDNLWSSGESGDHLWSSHPGQNAHQRITLLGAELWQLDQEVFYKSASVYDQSFLHLAAYLLQWAYNVEMKKIDATTLDWCEIWSVKGLKLLREMMWHLKITLRRHIWAGSDWVNAASRVPGVPGRIRS